MGDTILFVKENNSFLLNVIISSIEKNGYNTVSSGFSRMEVEKKLEGAAAVFLFLESDTMSTYMESFARIKDIAIDSGKKIYIMGDQIPVDKAAEFLGAGVKKVFYRPINAKDVTAIMLASLASNAKTGAKKSILVVDDSGTFLHTIKQWLEPKYKITMVNSATSGLTYLGKNTPDLILLDYEMPVCSGPQMLEMLRADSDLSNIPVIFLTGKGDRESISKVLALKPQGYLLKSLPQDKIVESVDEYFNKQLLIN